MKFSVNWLRDFVELPASIDELAELLTLAGVEIEAIERRGANFENVVVAQITASSQHPNADRLTVCMVDDGSGQSRQIVCGAKNYKVGDKVLLALPGAILPNDLKIRASKLRGVESEGMLCSGKELTLSGDAEGLLILPNESKIGAPIGTVFPDDTILNVEITPNRGDLLSHYGLAREIAALRNVAAAVLIGRLPPETAAATTSGRLPSETAAATSVTITALRECPFYSARTIENVTVGPSPQWLRAKIESVGIRSINNIVDITNLVMLEIGQPMHAFDADKLRGGINVRLAGDGEKFLALDGKTYSLSNQNLVIADAERAVGIGGVMGGEETGVTESTRNVLLEAAYFLPASVRRTARTLNLPSDASYRFERGVDPKMVLPASARAAELMREIAGGKPGKEIASAGEIPANPPEVSLSYERCNQLLGTHIAPKTIDGILKRFGLEKSKKEREEEESWSVPSYRRDLQRDVDLIEEIIRAHGVDKIVGLDRSRFTPASAADKSHDLETHLRGRLLASGLNEVRTSKLIRRNAAAFNENALPLRNPLSEDHVALRPSLTGGLLEVLDRNIRAGAERIAIFELGRVFVPPAGEEERRLGLLFWGKRTTRLNSRQAEKRQFDFFDLKGAIESVLGENLSFLRVQHPTLALAAEIRKEKKSLGIAGQLSRELTSQLDASGPVFIAEVSADLALGLLGSAKTFREIVKFPAITRDIAMIVPDTVTHEKVFETIQLANEPLLEDVTLFDVFAGREAEENFGAGHKSLAYTLTYRDKNRTLTSDEVTVVHARIRERLQRELAAELRE